MPLVEIVDANGVPQTVSWPGQDPMLDVSGAIMVAGTPQEVTAASTARGGFFFQNTSANPMQLQDVATGAYWIISPGAFFPPPGSGYPVPTAQINVIGNAAGDTFTARVW